MLIECTGFVFLNDSSKQKEGDKYIYNILSLNNRRMMIPFKKKNKQRWGGLNVGGGRQGRGY